MGINDFCAGRNALGQFWIGYHNLRTDRCVYLHILPKKEYRFWGRRKELDSFYDCVFYKQFYLGPFFAISWSSYNE